MRIKTMHTIMERLSLKTVKKLLNGRTLPVLGLGTYSVAREAVRASLDRGYRLIDTASSYDNEEEVGQEVKKSGIPREEIFVVTKLWNDEHGKEAAVQALKNSLNRLDMDYVDLYLMHSPAGGKVLETWDAMIQLKEQGLTRSIGVANFNASHLKHLKEARPGHVPVVNQIEIHPFLAWGECVSYCEEEGIAVMAYSPLTKGRKLRDPSLCKIAGKYGKTAAQVMIRWSLQRGFICIPKSSSGERIAENANIFDFDISDQDMKILNGLDEHLITDWPGIMNTPWEP